MATTAHTEAPGGHKGTFPPFDSHTFASQLVWLVITFVLL
ncbi:MAG: F0F1 ATP synthase subunit B', partial [Pseudolabrys sp.]